MSEFKDKNYYEILNIDKNATKAEIKKAFNSLARKYHPDVSKEPNCEEKFKKIYLSYETLYDDNKRQEYDKWLSNEHFSNSNENNFNESWEEKSFDPTWIDEILDDESVEELAIQLDSLSNLEKFSTFQYFWISFWTGSDITIHLFKMGNISKIFNIFFEKIDKSFIIQIANLIEDDDKDYFNMKLQKIFNNFNSIYDFEEKIEYMIDLINSNNVFNNEVSPVLSLLYFTNTFKLVNAFDEFINEYEINENLNRYEVEEQHWTKENNKKLVNNKGWIVIFLSIILVVILILSF